MKNLLNHYDLETIEKIPARFRGKFMNGRISTRGWYIRTRWDNDAMRRLYKKLDAIIKGSIGKDWNNIHSKLCKLCTNLSYDFSVKDYIQRTVSLNGYFNKWWPEHYFVDEDNILRETNPIKESKLFRKTKRETSENRKRKERKRKQNLKFEEEAIDNILRMINKPDLFKFYVSLKRQYDSLQRSIVDSERHYFECSTSNNLKGYKWFFRSKEYYEKKILEDKKEAKKIKDQLIQLELEGEFGLFYNSPLYLYSLQKECHHY